MFISAGSHDVAVHNRKQIVDLCPVHVCPFDIREFKNNLHPAIDASAHLGIVADERLVLAHALDDKAIRRKAMGIHQVIECCHRPRYREALVVTARTARVRVSVDLHQSIRIQAHDVRCFAKEVPGVSGQVAGV